LLIQGSNKTAIQEKINELESRVTTHNQELNRMKDGLNLLKKVFSNPKQLKLEFCRIF
jgi:uncharacterized coiled-coil protein SlyX